MVTNLSKQGIQVFDGRGDRSLSLVQERAHLFAHLILVQVPGVFCVRTWTGCRIRGTGDDVDLGFGLENLIG